MKMDPLPSENVLPKEDGLTVFRAQEDKKRTVVLGGYITVEDRVARLESQPWSLPGKMVEVSMANC